MKDGKNSKFDYAMFMGGHDDFAVNRDKYTLEQALRLYIRELGAEPGQIIAVSGDAFVRHHAGITEDDEPVVGWWLEYEEHKTSCPVYAMHLAYDIGKNFNGVYRFYSVNEILEEMKP